jgi:hypothetical protein
MASKRALCDPFDGVYSRVSSISSALRNESIVSFEYALFLSYRDAGTFMLM